MFIAHCTQNLSTFVSITSKHKCKILSDSLLPLYTEQLPWRKTIDVTWGSSPSMPYTHSSTSRLVSERKYIKMPKWIMNGRRIQGKEVLLMTGDTRKCWAFGLEVTLHNLNHNQKWIAIHMRTDSLPSHSPYTESYTFILTLIYVGPMIHLKLFPYTFPSCS